MLKSAIATGETPLGDEINKSIFKVLPRFLIFAIGKWSNAPILLLIALAQSHFLSFAVLLTLFNHFPNHFCQLSPQESLALFEMNLLQDLFIFINFSTYNLLVFL